MSTPDMDCYSLGMERIAFERERQIDAEGWTPQHDDEHSNGEMFQAAMCYLRATEDQSVPSDWPWEPRWWKPKDRLSNLVRAGALLIADKERLGRKRTFSGPWPIPVGLPFLIDGVALDVGREIARAGQTASKGDVDDA